MLAYIGAMEGVDGNGLKNKKKEKTIFIHVFLVQGRDAKIESLTYRIHDHQYNSTRSLEQLIRMNCSSICGNYLWRWDGRQEAWIVKIRIYYV